MFQWDAIKDLFDNPVVVRYIIVGIIVLVVIIICYSIHHKLTK
ncbi:MAG: hypothetical protein ACFE94_03995 [Candidatus Hodarchaeota archaeon]